MPLTPEQSVYQFVDTDLSTSVNESASVQKAPPRLTLERLSALTDGVLAIAMTILVLGIDIPVDHLFSEQGLFAFLKRMEPALIAYAASFWLAAAYWVQHHAAFHYLRFADRRLIWLNILFLFPVTLLPFVTKLRAIYVTEPYVVVLFGSVHIASSLAFGGLWRYCISHPHLLRKPMERSVARSMTFRILAAPLVDVLAILVSFVNHRLSAYLFLAMPLLYLSHRTVDSHWDDAGRPESADHPGEKTSTTV